jgi:hypothetical protein
MTNLDIINRRLNNQRLVGAAFEKPEEVVAWQGAVQAQDYAGAKWAAGCLDIDLGFTPATNLIALRRLALDVGHEADAPAAYLAFPELKLERLEQRYHRLTLDKYDYQAPSVGYVGTLEVSEVGFVTTYPGLWEVVNKDFKKKEK